ncbi:MAG TPA: twin-arginine translocase TatA/TatE family subunit [Longimicrobium sp.]
MPFGLGFGETLLILAVILLFFGPKRLPDAAASLGKGIREFKRAMSGLGEELTAPTNTVAAPPAPPPHAALAGTGADPLAVPSSGASITEAPSETVASADPATAAP